MREKDRKINGKVEAKWRTELRGHLGPVQLTMMGTGESGAFQVGDYSVLFFTDIFFLAF